MMKRFVLNLLAVCLLLTMMVPAAFATETTEATRPAAPSSNSCGEGLTWSYSGGTLTITGSGAMDDFEGDAPWASYKDDIQKLVLSGGVTTVGAGAFSDYDSLKSIDFGGSLKEIGVEAFKSCEGLTVISLPSAFRRFGASSFEGCSNLTEVYCAGGMPSFNGNCLWNGNYITVYCPTNNPWPQEYVEELETNFHGRLEILCADGTDMYVYEVETTEAATEPVTEPTTVPTTEAATEPTEEETTVPESEETTAPAEETTEAAEETEEETQIPEESEEPKEKKSLNGILIGIFIISGTLSLLLIGALIFKGSRGGRYKG